MALNIAILEGENWWGGVVELSNKMPFSRATIIEIDLNNIKTSNQINTMFISNKGGYFYSHNPFKVCFYKGTITIEGKDIISGKASSMKEAYEIVSKDSFKRSPFKLPDVLFDRPQFNTWIQLMYNQNQKDIIEYAKSIVDAGFLPGGFIIDCGWQKEFGVWDFKKEKFENPTQMVDQLHELGFKVELWYVPFIDPNTEIFAQYSQEGKLILDSHKPLLSEWWDGISGVLDFMVPQGNEEFDNISQGLIDNYHIDGFKFDAGDLYFYKDNAVESSKAYVRKALNYPFNELRSCYQLGGESIIQRAADRHHTWDNQTGLKSLVPISLLQNLLGYFYCCADMIGGGEYISFSENTDKLDLELFIRNVELCALMPTMQFSYAFWNRFENECKEISIGYAKIRYLIRDFLLALRDRAYDSFEPIICYPEFLGYENLGEDIFFLGKDIIVAPVTNKGDRTKTIKLPKGRWKYYGHILEGDKEYTVDAPLYVLPVFEREGANIGICDKIKEQLNSFDFQLNIK